MSSFQRVILLGPPASGKGTQAKKIGKILNLPILGTGNLLRQAVEGQTELGKKVQQFIENGHYVPDCLVEDLVVDWVKNQHGAWVFDGFPRTQQQASFINDTKSIGTPEKVIGLSVPVEELERRINSRLQCRVCDAVTNTFVHSLPACPEDSCDGELYSRNDDAIDSFRVRYNQYQELTAPLFDYYENLGILFRVDGSQSPDQVANTIKSHLDTASV